MTEKLNKFSQSFLDAESTEELYELMSTAAGDLWQELDLMVDQAQGLDDFHPAYLEAAEATLRKYQGLRAVG